MPFGQQRVQGTGSNSRDLQQITLETFLCTEEDKVHQELEIFGERFVVLSSWSLENIIIYYNYV